MSTTDAFANLFPGLNSPAAHAEAITPDDNNDISHVTRAVYVGAGGNLAVVMAGGETVTFSAVPAGAQLRIRVSRVKATGTTAGGIVGLC